MFADLPDLLRLLAVPFFGYVAWRDIKTRRVPNRTWLPLAALAVVLLAWEAYGVFTGDTLAFERRLFAIQVGISLGVVIPLAYLFWRVGGFGGADAKAFFVIAVLFPTFPTYVLADLSPALPVSVLPVFDTTLGVFSLTILSNTVLVGLAYPVVLAARNVLRGRTSPAMFVAKPIRPEQTITEYGSLLHFADRSLTQDLSPSGLRAYFSWRGLDLDALRMYLRWRDATLAELMARPDHFRNPASLPDEPNDPGDGAIVTDGGTTTDSTEHESEDTADPPAGDPWGAEAFLSDIEGTAYGTDPDSLREGLDAIVTEDVVWISPGIPFLVPLFGGLVVALSFGDLLFFGFEAIGLG